MRQKLAPLWNKAGDFLVQGIVTLSRVSFDTFISLRGWRCKAERKGAREAKVGGYLPPSLRALHALIARAKNPTG